MTNNIIVKHLGIQPYKYVFKLMHEFTNIRNKNSLDEIWLVQHPKVFTQGINGKKKHILTKTNIPIIKSDRGGQITFHGPGQQIAYILIDLRRRNINIHQLINILEQIVINTLSNFNIKSTTYQHSPGIYVNKHKICSIGLKIKKGCSLHGIAINVNMDLSPFLLINPCGHIGLKMTQISYFYPNITINKLSSILEKNFFKFL